MGQPNAGGRWGGGLSGESICGAAALRREMEAAHLDVEAAAKGDKE